MRLSLIYAVLDRKRSVDVGHLESALAVWNYCDTVAKSIFGDGKHDVRMEKLIAGLEAAPEGMTRTQIARFIFRSHVSKEELTALLDMARTGGNLINTYIPQGTKAHSWMHKKYVEGAHRAHLRTAHDKD